jgi:arsenate reductase (glutaredoxin)
MKYKLYHLANCTTCQLIIKDTGINPEIFELQDIKTEKISAPQLDELKEMAGSYEALFSRRALLYKSMGLKDVTLTETDYRRLILEEYTFLKRPVAVIGKEIFIGNAPKTVAALGEKIRSLK